MEAGLERNVAPDGSLEVTLRPAGAARWVGVVFLGVWLCGWAAGELVALRVLGVPLDAIPFAARLPIPRLRGPGTGFLVLWLSVWTFGGLAALFAWLRLLAGRDRLFVREDALEVAHTAFGLGRRRRIARDALAGITLRRKDGTLLALEGSREVPLTDLGTREARRALADELRARYRLGDPAAVPAPATGEAPVPRGWEARLDSSGAWVVRLDAAQRRRTSGCLGTVAALIAVGIAAWIVRHGWGALRSASVLPVSVFAVLALASALFAAAREEIAAASNLLELRRSAGPWRRTRTFAGASLRASFSNDSDGDEWYRLEVVTPEGAPVRLWSGTNDRVTPVLLGRWLAARTGWRFDEGIPPET